MEYTEDIDNELETGTNPIKVLLRFVPYWPVFLGLGIVSLAGAFTYLHFAKPIYESNASLLIKDEHQGMADARLFSSLNISNSSKIIENEVEVLSSKTLMKEVVTKLNLYAPIYFDGTEAKGSAYDYCPISVMVSDPANFEEVKKVPFRYDSVNQRVIIEKQSFPLNAWLNLKWGSIKFAKNPKIKNTSPSNLYYFSLIPVKSVANDLLSGLTVLQPGKKATVVLLKLQSPVPSMSEDVLNELISTYDKDAFKAKNTQISNTLNFVENRLQYLVKELDSVESAVQQFRSEKGVVNVQQQGQGLVLSAEVTGRKLTDIEGQLEILNEVERYMGNARSNEPSAPAAQSAPVPSPVAKPTRPSDDDQPVNPIDEKDLGDAKEHLRSINAQLAVLKDAPPIDQYYNMRLIRVQSEIRHLNWDADKRDLKAKLAAKDVILKALQKRSRMTEDNVDDVQQRISELTQAKVDVEQEIASLSRRRPAPSPSPVAQESSPAPSRRVLKQSSGAGTVSAIPSTIGLKDPSLSGLLERYYDLQNDYESRRQTVSESNPIMLGLQSQIERTEKAIIQNVRFQRNNLQAGRENLFSQSENVGAMIASIPKTEKALKGIGRTQGTTSEIYSFLLQKREENALLLASDISDNKQLDYADTSPFPVAPKRQLVLVLAMTIALAGGVGFVTIKKAMNPVLESKAELVDMINLPIVGEIFEARGKAGILANESVSNAEQFRQLRTSLDFMGVFPGKKNLLITSAVPGEGKSFVASNLALSLALTGKKVLLVELDLHKAKLANMLESNNDLGMSEFLQGKAGVDEVIRSTGLDPNLFLVPAGVTPENPSELILTDRMNNFFDEVATRFDYVIVKSAPVSQLTDAFVISKKTDATIFVLRQNYTPLAAIRELQAGNMFNTLGKGMVVLNGVKENSLEEKLN